VTVEAAAIVASILLAFTIDAWWDQLQERSKVNEHLVSILADMQTAEEYVQFYRRMALAKQESIERLMVAASSATDKLADESLDKALHDLGYYAETNIMPEGSIEALIASGNMRLIESEVLQRKLSGWTSFLSYVRENISPDYQYVFNVWDPYLRKNGNSTQVGQYALMGMPGHPNDVWVENFPKVAYGHFDHSVLLEDPEFRNILKELWTTQAGLLSALEELQDEIFEVIPLVQSEIARN